MKHFTSFADFTGNAKPAPAAAATVAEKSAPEWKIGKSYQDGIAKKVEKIGKDKVKVTFDSGDTYTYQIDKYNPENWVQVDESAQLYESATEIALGIVGGVAGIWALQGAAAVLGNLAVAFGQGLSDTIKSATKRASTKARRELISGITKKFEGDVELEKMYAQLPPYSDKNAKARTKQLKDIADYIKSKLSDDEMKYFTDISSMLRTGDVKEYVRESIHEAKKLDDDTQDEFWDIISDKKLKPGLEPALAALKDAGFSAADVLGFIENHWSRL